MDQSSIVFISIISAAGLAALVLAAFFVKRLNEDCFLMKDGREIPLSRDGRTALKNRYMAYVFGRMEE